LQSKPQPTTNPPYKPTQKSTAQPSLSVVVVYRGFSPTTAIKKADCIQKHHPNTQPSADKIENNQTEATQTIQPKHMEKSSIR